MTIRGTQNQGIQRVKRSVVGTTINLVLAGADEANAIVTEKRESDTPAAFQSTTPGNEFNGTVV